MPFLPPNQQHQSTVGKADGEIPYSDVEQKSGINKSAIFYYGTTVFIEVPYEEF